MIALLKRSFSLVVILSLTPVLGFGAKLMCPENPDDTHRKDIMATSAPEVKARTSSQDDGKRWSDIVRPLTQKAIKSAKAQRAKAIAEGIERGCPSNETFVGQLVLVPDRPSGCEHRIVTRPADDEHIWVQVVAVCKYDWMCCGTDDPKMSKGSSTAPAGFTLEGPLVGNSASNVQSSPSTSAPTKLKK